MSVIVRAKWGCAVLSGVVYVGGACRKGDVGVQVKKTITDITQQMRKPAHSFVF